MHNQSTFIANPLESQYSVFSIESLKMVVPRNYILSIETIFDLNPLNKESNSGCISEITINNMTIPVYSIDQNLDILKDLPASRRACLLLKSDINKYFGIVIDSINSVNTTELSIHQIPSCMTSDYSPIQKVLQLDNEIYGMIDSTLLSSLLNVDIYYASNNNQTDELIASNA